MIHPARLPVEDLVKDCEFRTTRRSGPGGQHRNKVETAVVVEYLPFSICAEANELRSQHANRVVAIHRLRVKLALEVRTAPLSMPSPMWISRIRGGRFSVSLQHEDYPALLAEALNVVASLAGRVDEAAVRLRITATQLCKFLRTEPRAWQEVNLLRVAQGLPRLR